MPSIALRCPPTADEKEEILAEYICDWPDCPNVAEHVLGAITELHAFVALCPEHARAARRGRSPS